MKDLWKRNKELLSFTVGVTNSNLIVIVHILAVSVGHKAGRYKTEREGGDNSLLAENFVTQSTQNA